MLDSYVNQHRLLLYILHVRSAVLVTALGRSVRWSVRWTESCTYIYIYPY